MVFFQMATASTFGRGADGAAISSAHGGDAMPHQLVTGFVVQIGIDWHCPGQQQLVDGVPHVLNYGGLFSVGLLLQLQFLRSANSAARLCVESRWLVLL